MPAADLSHLRARIAALEGRGGRGASAQDGAVALGVAAIDRTLPWGGLARGDLHEVTAGDTSPAALAFTALLAARRLQNDARPLLWISAGALPHAPALAALGLAPERMVMVRPSRPAQVLWALEECLRSPAVAAVVAQTTAIAPIAARRLHLAVRESAGLALLLNSGPALAGAATRWRVATMGRGTDTPATATAAPQETGDCRWQVALLRCRGRSAGDDGTIATWNVDWHEQTHRLCLAAPPGDRAVAPERRRAAG